MTIQKHAERIRAFYRAFNERSFEAVADSITEDFVLEDVGTGRTYHGHHGLLRWAKFWIEAVPDAYTEITNLIAQDHWVATEHLGMGTHVGPLALPTGKIEATNKRVRLEGAQFFLMRGPKVAMIRAYWNPHSFDNPIHH